MDAQYFYEGYLDSFRNKTEMTPEFTGAFHLWVYGQSDELKQAVFVAERLAGQYARGLRCGVCGMTTKQAEAANYNCTEEC